MKINSPVTGRTRPSEQGLGYFEADSSGVARSFSQMAAALGGIGEKLLARDDENAKFDALIKFDGTMNSMNEKFIEWKRDALPDDPNNRDRAEAMWDTHWGEYLNSLPPSIRKEFEVRAASAKQTYFGQVLEFDLQLKDQYALTGIQKSLSTEQTFLDQSPSAENLTASLARINEKIDASGLGENQKQKLKDDAYYELALIPYKKLKAGSTEWKDVKSSEKASSSFLQDRWDPRATRAPHFDVNPIFGKQLQDAITEAEAATGKKVSIRSLRRTREEQIDARRRYESGKAGIAARPSGEVYRDKYGNVRRAPGSRHERGMAADLNDGLVLQWLRDNRAYVKDKYGLEFLPDNLNDPGHIQLSREVTPKLEEGNFNSLWSAIEYQESRNRQSAVSPKGAVGVAQVMPAMGPAGARLAGLEWDAERFRTDEDYNRKIGQALLRDELKRYKGDMTKAAAAYNAGSPRVDKEIAAHGNDWLQFMPEETRNYVSNVIGSADTASGAFDQNIDNDPRFVGIPFEMRMAATKDAYNEVSAQRSAALKAQTEAEKEFANQAFISARAGKWTNMDTEKAMSQGLITDYDTVHKLDTILKDRQAADADRRAGLEAINSRTILRSDNSEDNKIANAVIGDEGVARLRAGDEAYFSNVVVPQTDANRMIAPIVTQTLSSMVRQEPNPERFRSAIDMMWRLSQQNPDAFSTRVDKTTQDMVTAYGVLRGSVTGADLMTKVRGGTTAEEIKQTQVMKEEAQTEIRDPEFAKEVQSLAESNLPGFFSSLLFGDAQLNQTGWKQPALARELNAAYVDFRSRGMGKTEALQAAGKSVFANWGFTQFGTQSTYLKYPPEKFLPPEVMKYGTELIQDDLFYKLNVKDGEEFELISDDKTENEVLAYQRGERTELPSYAYAIKDINGNWTVRRDQRVSVVPPPEVFERISAIYELEQAENDLADFEAKVMNPASIESMKTGKPVDEELMNIFKTKRENVSKLRGRKRGLLGHLPQDVMPENLDPLGNVQGQ